MNSELAKIRHERAVRWLIPLFLASGATSLIYETVWERQLHLVFGTSQVAVSTVLAAFMTGLALGGFGGAKWADKVHRPIRAYAMLEAMIGIYALAFPSLVEMVQPVYQGFYHAFQPSPTAFGAFQFLILGLMLLPPTFCMGMTLPLLSRFASTASAESGEQVGRLYGANTIGAVLGVGLAGFYLLPTIGLSATTWCAAGANLALCVGALLLSRTVEALPAAQGVPDTDAAGWSVSTLGIIAMFAGFSALLYEVAWFRLMALILGASAYAFSVMLFSFLLGLGSGGWLGGPLSDKLYAKGKIKRVLLGLAVLEAGIAILTWAAMYLYAELPWLFIVVFDNMATSPLFLWTGKLLLAMCVMVPPAFLMGLAFPLLVRAAAGESLALGKPVGRLYGWNTVGAIFGAGLGGLVFLPWLFVRGTVLLAITVNVFVAALAWYRSGDPGQSRLIKATVGGLFLSVGLHLFSSPWNPLQMTAGTYKYVFNMEDHSREGVYLSNVKPYELLYYAEGLSSVVTVAKNRETGDIWLANNGKIDASSKADLPTQVLVSHMPFFYRPESETVMMLGLAAGYSAGSAALHTQPKVIDLVEIEERIIDASHFFDEWNHHPLDDERVVLKVNDARNHLNLTPDGHYDLIVAEPSNPWLTGVSNLFTKEYFEMGKKKLKKGGIWSQWIQIYGMDTDDLRSLLGTFSDTYPYVHLFSTIKDADLVLVGSESPLVMDVEAFQSTIDNNPRVAADLLEIEIDSSYDLLARFRLGRDKLQELAAGIERNTDDNMRVEYSAPLNLYTWTGDENVLMLEESVGKVPLVPYGATTGVDGLLELAKSYAEIDLYVQALMCLKEAVKREEDDVRAQKEAQKDPPAPRTDIDALYGEYQAALAVQIDEANAAISSE
jgi:spermidine synthase